MLVNNARIRQTARERFVFIVEAELPVLLKKNWKGAGYYVYDVQ